MKIEKKINIIELLTFIALIFGGLLGYFFVDKIKLNESIADTNLKRVQTKIAAIDESFRGIITKQEIRNKKIDATINLSEFIADMQPNIKIDLQPKFEYEDNNIHLRWEITNIGKHTVVIDKISVLLSPNIINETTRKDSYLSEGNDYRVFIPKIGELPPNQITHHDFEITLSKDVNLNRIYHYTKFYSHIHPSVEDLANKLLSDLFTGKEINNLVVRSYGRSGWLKLKKR